MLNNMKQKVKKFLSGQSMKNMIYWILIVITLAVSGFTGFFVSSRYDKYMNSLAEKDIMELAEQTNVSMSQYIHSMIRLSDSMYYNVIKNNLKDQDQVLQAMYDANKDLVENIVLFRRNGKLIQSVPAGSLTSYSDVKEEEWFKKALKSSENIHFFQPQIQDYFEQDQEVNWVIPMSRFVQITEEKDISEGVLLINIKYGAFSEVFRNETEEKGRYSFLMDREGNLIYHPKHTVINEGLMEAPPAELALYKDGTYSVEINGEKTLACVKTVGYTGWKIVSTMNKQNLSKVGMKGRLFVIFVILILGLCSMMVSDYFSRVLTRPVQNLETDVKRIAGGELDLQVHTSGSYEMFHLGRSIQKMAGKIQQLMQEVIREQEEKRKSELDSLQAQITPHFLYNTLDIIVWMIEEERRQEAVQVVSALARLFRISLSKGKNIISVGDELEHVRNYLIIQSMRFKDQFTYSIEADEEVRGMSVIKLVVQPIVENAIYHGMKGMFGDGEIRIHAYRKEGDLYISVKDNGLGMKEEQVEELLDYTKEIKVAKGNGLGVRNVHERIQLYFGKQYGLEIYSELDVGTEILLHLPTVIHLEDKKL